MSQRHSEAALETVIEAQLLAHGYIAVDRDGFDRKRAIFPEGHGWRLLVSHPDHPEAY